MAIQFALDEFFYSTRIPENHAFLKGYFLLSLPLNLRKVIRLDHIRVALATQQSQKLITTSFMAPGRELTEESAVEIFPNNKRSFRSFWMNCGRRQI